MPNGSPKVAAPKMTPQQINQMQRQAVLSQAVEMVQPIFQSSPNPQVTSQFNIPPKNVGLIKRFIVELTGTYKNNDAAAATLTDFGLSNLLPSVVFTDLNNNTRIQTTGAHLTTVAKEKYRAPYGGLYTVQESGPNPNWGVITPTGGTVAAGATQAFRMQFEIPLAYSDDDLRGAIFANVVNATMNLQLNFAPGGIISALAAADTTGAVYANAASNTTLQTLNITVYQVYLDQLPIGKNGVVLPILDLSTVYELKNTVFTALAPGAEYPVPYSNFRDFLSTTVVYVNNGVARLSTGADINYWALQSANFTNIFKKTPLMVAFEQRMITGDDLPAGCYYFSSRRKPINTSQYGNMQLILNPITAAAGAYLQVGWEDFALVNTLTAAGSLAG